MTFEVHKSNMSLSVESVLVFLLQNEVRFLAGFCHKKLLSLSMNSAASYGTKKLSSGKINVTCVYSK